MKINELEANIKERGIKITTTEHGLAHTDGHTFIAINPILRQYSELYADTLKHELEHLKDPSFIGTLRIDLKALFDIKSQVYANKILWKHQKMLTQSMSPLIFHKGGKIGYSAFLVVFYVALILLVVGIALLF